MQIIEDDLSNPRTLELLSLHLAGMNANSPPENVFALDRAGLRSPDVTLWSAWAHEEILGIAALRQLDRLNGELKSMRTHPNHLRKGVAAALLNHIIRQAQDKGLKRLSLETGSGSAFEPALQLYRTHGFTRGDVFGDYRASDFNQFLHLELA